MGRADALKPGRRKNRHPPLARSELPIDTVSLECPLMGEMCLWLDHNGRCPTFRSRWVLRTAGVGQKRKFEKRGSTAANLIEKDRCRYGSGSLTDGQSLANLPRALTARYRSRSWPTRLLLFIPLSQRRKAKRIERKTGGRQKIAPHGDCAINGMAVKPVGRQSPFSTRFCTARAKDQSSFSGKLPRGFTTMMLAT